MLRSGDRHQVDSQLTAMHAAGVAAFTDHDRGADVLDLAFDSIVDAPDLPADDVRRLRFEGPGCTVDVDVRGYGRLIVELRISPAGPVVLESRTPGVDGRRMIVWSHGRTLIWWRPQVTSFLLRWPGSERRPARTAWLRL